jgi:hypothetical protein
VSAELSSRDIYGDLGDCGRLEENGRRERVHRAILPFAEVRQPYAQCPFDWTSVQNVMMMAI